MAQCVVSTSAFVSLEADMDVEQMLETDLMKGQDALSRRTFALSMIGIGATAVPAAVDLVEQPAPMTPIKASNCITGQIRGSIKAQTNICEDEETGGSTQIIFGAE